MQKTNEIKRDPASFRDPAANVYSNGKIAIREIYTGYFPEYDQFMEKVYPELIDQDLIIPHRVMARDENRIIIYPEIIPFISYPYEWSFQMLKEAALVTLMINKMAMDQDMILKDASAYNIQYYEGRMKLIDTTSFMFYSGDTPWGSYSQFLRHFLAPLLWIKYVNSDMRRLQEIYIDGIPIPLTNRMIPFKSRFKSGIMLHILSQSVAGDLFQDSKRIVKMNRVQLSALLGNLAGFIERLTYEPPRSSRGWIKYNEFGSYSSDSLTNKKDIVYRALKSYSGGDLLDIGANTGEYSKIAVNCGYKVIAVDNNHDCINSLYSMVGVLPLVVDVCNPSPGIGWNNRERRSFWERIGGVDVILALALIHHLCVRNNVPLGMVADLLADHCQYLIIEWVPLDDPQAQKLLGVKNIPEYSLDIFKREFSRHFKIINSKPIDDSKRAIFLMEKIKGEI